MRKRIFRLRRLPARTATRMTLAEFIGFDDQLQAMMRVRRREEASYFQRVPAAGRGAIRAPSCTAKQ